MEIKEKIIDILSVHSDKENVNQYLHENDDLNQLGMNSISFIKMVIDLESEFNFEFEDEALNYSKFTSLNLFCGYVEEQMRLNNVTYSPDENRKDQNAIRKEIIDLLSQHSDNPLIRQTAFNYLTDLNLSQTQIEKVLSSVQEKFNIKLDTNIMQHENLLTLDNLCKYILDNV